MKQTHFRWVIVGILFFICTVNYVDRSAISYALNQISHEFSLNSLQQGLILGAFGIGYFVTTLLGGILVDRYGCRITLLFATLLWSLSIGLTGFAMNFMMLYLLRITLGLAEGPNFPAITRAITDWLPQKERAVALSLALIAVPLALAIGAPLVTQLIVHTSWRGMFIILGVLGVLWLPLWLWLFRDFPFQSRHVNQDERAYIMENTIINTDADVLAQRQRKKGVWKFLLTNPTLLTNYWSFFVFGYFLFFFMAWLPSYLEHQYHLNLTQVGLFSILPWVVAAILLWAVGYLSDFLFKTTTCLRYARTYPIAVMQLLAAICVVPIIYSHDIVVTIIFLSLAIGFSMGSNAPFYAVTADIAKARAGTALGIMDSTFAIAGFIAPALTGYAVEKTGSFTTAFVILAILALSSVILMLAFHQPDRCRKLDEGI